VAKAFYTPVAPPGTGLHTFVLYLGPLVAKATIAATECGSTDFLLYGPDRFICPPRDASFTAEHAGVRCCSPPLAHAPYTSRGGSGESGLNGKAEQEVGPTCR